MKVLLATHPQLVPAQGSKGAEFDVFSALKKLGHQVSAIGFSHEARALDRALLEFKPDIVFNLLEELRAEAVYDFHLVTRLESLDIPFTGCNPRGLIVSRNKFIATQVAAAAGVSVPDSVCLRGGTLRAPRGLKYPLFAKFNREHSSLGIRESNRVTNEASLNKVLSRLERDYGLEILLQDFIPGLEVSVSLWGNARPQLFAARRLSMKGATQIATEKKKFDLKFQKTQKMRRGIFTGELPKGFAQSCARAYEALDLSGYARFDFRVNAEGKAFLIDVNANPSLAKDEDFALSTAQSGLEYPGMIERVLQLGRTYSPRR